MPAPNPGKAADQARLILQLRREGLATEAICERLNMSLRTLRRREAEIRARRERKRRETESCVAA